MTRTTNDQPPHSTTDETPSGQRFIGLGEASCQLHDILVAANAVNDLDQTTIVSRAPIAAQILNGLRSDIRWECAPEHIQPQQRVLHEFDSQSQVPVQTGAHLHAVAAIAEETECVRRVLKHGAHHYEKSKKITSVNKPIQQILERNQAFLQAWKIDSIKLDEKTHRELHAVLSAQHAVGQEVNILLERSKAVDDLQRQAIQRDAMIANFRGVEASFWAISQLGTFTENHTLTTIGNVGAAGASIALNTALLTGAIPGVQLTGLAALSPYAAIALAGIAIASTLFRKKKKNAPDDSLQQALKFISSQIHQLRSEMHTRFDRIEEAIVILHQNLIDTLTQLKNGLETYLTNMNHQINSRLDLIQMDLHQLAQLTTRRLEANYLQPFILTCDAIDQYAQMSTPAKDEMQKLLITLNTWLSNPGILNNLNGGWLLPGMPSTTWFDAQHLRQHQNVFGFKPAETSDQLLGYLAQLMSVIPGVNLSAIQPTQLPNIPIFIEGVKKIILARTTLGAAEMANIDPSGASINAVREIIANTLRFFDILQAQKIQILQGFFNEYRNAMKTLFETMQQAARIRLQTGDAIGFQLQNMTTICEISLPTQMSNTGLPTLVTAKVTSIIRNNPNCVLSNFILAALGLGIGEIRMDYSGVGVPASKTRVFGHRHTIQPAQGKYSANVHYMLYDNGRYIGHHSLFTLHFQSIPAAYQTTLYGRCFEQAFNGQGMGNNPNHNVPANLSTLWDNAELMSVEVYKTPIPEQFKQQIIDRIIAVCFNNRNNYTQCLMYDLSLHQSLLNNQPRHLTVTRQLIGVYANLMGVDIGNELTQLKDENDFLQALNSGMTHSNELEKINSIWQAISKRVTASTSQRDAWQQLLAIDHLLAMTQRSEEMYREAHSIPLMVWENEAEKSDSEKTDEPESVRYQRGVKNGEMAAIPLICALLLRENFNNAARVLSNDQSQIKYELDFSGMSFAERSGVLFSFSSQISSAILRLLTAKEYAAIECVGAFHEKIKEIGVAHSQNAMTLLAAGSSPAGLVANDAAQTQQGVFLNATARC